MSVPIVMRSAAEMEKLRAEALKNRPATPTYIGVDLGKGDDGYVFGVKLPKGSYLSQADNAVRLPDGSTVAIYDGPEGIQLAVDKYMQALHRREREPHEFFAFCQAQFPELIETFRRLEVVKAQFARFAGKAER